MEPDNSCSEVCNLPDSSHPHTLTHHDCFRFALKDYFTIYVFLGPFSEDPKTWDHSGRLVGIDGIFVTRNLDNCENCRDQNENGLVDSDVIPLTTPLVAYWRRKEILEA